MEIHIAQDRIIYFVNNDEIDKLFNKKILTTKIDIGNIYLRFAIIIENSKEEIDIGVDSDGYVLKIANSALSKFFDVSRGKIAIHKNLKINEKNIMVGAAVINKEN